MKDKNTTTALKYFNQSAELETKTSDKAKVYFKIGEVMKKKGSLGKARSQNAVNQNNIFDFLNKSVREAESERKELSIFQRVLDADGDGNIVDDVAGMGMKVLGGFLRGRR